ncbi:hypothetical protein K435DRAFT_905794 [Dendrothele bispora CBS 962.96]|uniref:SWIM-type domain-containing protein n=1 Tax=Dendrothele bispora (strain CBS 962.96) TaxID=1314807 RepID=A0A4V4HAK5_DENBC|nr:hypothetical protein K435DRAFT_905794 [Dendrothele bispora CBS 962.96]
MAIQTRLERYMSQSSRTYLIDRQREEGENKEEFTVQGSTGNVYTVTIDEVSHCDCPDHLKGNRCKHILFIFVKVLQVPLTSGLWYQKALLPSELASIFSSAPAPPQLRQQLRNIHTNESVVGAGREKTGRGPKDSRRIPEAEDDCPICYDKMNENKLEKVLDWCVVCRNTVHKECWGTWKTTTARQGKPLTCVWCRAPWTVAGPSTSNHHSDSIYASREDEGYLNLGSISGSGASPVRDTSTYYHGPRRGQNSYGVSRRGYYM